MATHLELITSQSFEVKFKRTLLNYYNYGYKTREEHKNNMNLSLRTLNDDWSRLNYILKDYYIWSYIEKTDSVNRKNTLFISLDSESMCENPFNRVYRFCLYRLQELIYFIHTIALLGNKMSISNDINNWNEDWLKGQFKKYEDQQDFLNKITEKFEKKIEEGKWLYTHELLYFYPLEILNRYTEKSKDQNKTTNNNLNKLKRYGMVQTITNDSKDSENRDWNRWCIPKLTIGGLLEEAAKLNNNNLNNTCSVYDFRERFFSLLDFYSKYYIFGEIGVYLMDRLGLNILNKNDLVFSKRKRFRMKHDYFMQSLNDFNLIDLLYAIENNKWCRIEYIKGTSVASAMVILCYPLEVRISTMTGREYLMIYEPVKRSCSSLRIEFIESIEYFEDNVLRESLISCNYHKSNESIDSDLNNARKLLGHLWGISIGKKSINNLVKLEKDKKIKLTITYNPDKEGFIVNRLKRERRCGKVDVYKDKGLISFEVDTIDTKELKPFIRGYYSRIVSCEGMEQVFNIKTDLKRMIKLFECPLYPVLNSNTDIRKSTNSSWNIPEKLNIKLNNPKMMMKAEEHDKLFNGIFNVYYHIISDVFFNLCRKHKDGFTKKDFNDTISNLSQKYSWMSGEQTNKILIENELKKLKVNENRNRNIDIFKKSTTENENQEQDNDLFFNGGFIYWKNGRIYPKYKCNYDENDNYNLKFYKDVVPLSEVELRWILTVLNDEKASLFLSLDEIKCISDFINKKNPNIKNFATDKIVYYDRFKHNEVSSNGILAPNINIKVRDYFQRIITAIEKEIILKIKYKTMKGHILEGEFKPIIIEYSMRNDHFQGFFLRSKKKMNKDSYNEKIYLMNIFRIECISDTDKKYSYDDALRSFEKYKEKHMKSVVLEFYDKNKLLDRILTEFAPWKKICVYDPDTKLYNLTIYYQNDDKMDIVVRLLGYGSYFRFKNEDNNKRDGVAHEFYRRVKKQMQLLNVTASQ